MCTKRHIRVAFALLVVGTAFWHCGPRRYVQFDGKVVRHSQEDWRGAVRHINETPDHRHFPVLFYSGLIEADALNDEVDEKLRAELREYCLFPISGIYSVERNTRQVMPLSLASPRRLNKEIWGLVKRQGGAWLIIRGREKTTTKFTAEFLASLRSQKIPVQIVDNQTFGQLRVVIVSLVEKDK